MPRKNGDRDEREDRDDNDAKEASLEEVPQKTGDEEFDALYAEFMARNGRAYRPDITWSPCPESERQYFFASNKEDKELENLVAIGVRIVRSNLHVHYVAHWEGVDRTGDEDKNFFGVERISFNPEADDLGWVPRSGHDPLLF